MKRLLTLVALAFAAATSFGATLNPIQLLNPAGSTSGQAIVSTGPTTAPAWGGPFASSTGTTFTGATGVSYASPVFFVNDSTGAGLASMFLRNSGSNAWNLYSASTSSNQFALGRYVAGSFVDNPIAVSNSTGLVSLGDGLSASTIAASSTITPSQTAGIVGTTTNNNANAGSVGEYLTVSATAVSLSSGVSANVCSLSVTAGDWDITGNMITTPAGSTTTTTAAAGLNTTTAALPAVPFYGQIGTAGAGIPSSPPIPTQRFTFSATTTVFLVANVQFAVSTMTGSCYIGARRRR